MLAAAALGALAGTALDRPPRPAVQPSPVTATAAVSRQSLVETTTVSGTLGYAHSRRVTARTAGTVTWLAGEGSAVSRGEALFQLDGRPVTLLAGRVPAYRRLAEGTTGEDVRQLEEALRHLGYEDFRVDDRYTRATAAAVREWQEDLDVPKTGVVELGAVVFGASAVRVGAHQVEIGDPVSPGATVLATTDRRQRVTVDLEVDKQRYARRGAAVTVELPDGREVTGRITHVGTVARGGGQESESGTGNDGAGEAADPTIKVEIRLPRSTKAGGLDQTPVQVEVESARLDGVLTVPVTALLARPEGGYAVEVVAGGSTRTVPVTTGMFAGGRVEVRGAGLRPGVVVEVPSQ